VLSGYVMLLSLHNKSIDDNSWKRFLIARVCRIVPIYWALLIIKFGLVTVFSNVSFHNSAGIKELVLSALFVPYYNAEGQISPLLGVAWTLLHEVVFYGILASAIKSRLDPFLFPSLIIASLVAAGLLLPSDNAIWRVWTSPLNMLFVAGMLLFKIQTQSHKQKIPNLPLLASICACTYFLLGKENGTSSTIQDLNIPAIIFVFLFLKVESNGNNWATRYGARLGDASYSIYLLHPFVAPAICLGFWKIGLHNKPAIIILTAIISLTAGYIFHILIENRLNTAIKSILIAIFFPKKALS